jgi:anaerobic selenocysteine-containing dehydrogenase
MLRSAPRGIIHIPLETRYRKYQRSGFGTPSGKVEIFSTALQAIGQSPFPEFHTPRPDPIFEFPLVLTSAKTPIYCHSQHRNLSRLRRVIPEPIVEVNPATAASSGIGQGDWTGC